MGQMHREYVLDIEERLIHLARDGDPAAAQEFANLNRVRREWQRTESSESLERLISQARSAEVWIAGQF